MQESKSASIKTPVGRVAFAYVFEKNTYSDTPKYELTLTGFDPKELAALSKAVVAAAQRKWGANMPRNLRSPFRDGGEKEGLEGFEKGQIFITFRTTRRPGIVDARGSLITSPEEFYSGCWARVSCSPYAYDRRGNKGVAFGLNNIQKVKDDEPFVGGPSVEDDFPAEDYQDATAYQGLDDLFANNQGDGKPIF